jgi:uncharacterized damage-inducible protein DinB
MAHPLVDQLRFARQEFERGLAEVSAPEAQQRFGSLNCISWIVGHLAWQEQRYWLTRAQALTLLPELNERLAYGKPACTPLAEDMWSAWRQVTQAGNAWLDELTPATIQEPLVLGYSSVGTFLQRMIYHYWYHLGEGMAVRQLLGHSQLPDFVGDIDSQAPYRSEAGGGPPAQDRENFLKYQRQSRQRWEAALNQVSPDRMLEPLSPGGWTLKDVIAHLTWHEKQMLNVVRNRVFGGSDLWQLPLEERNQAIYAEIRGQSLSDTMDEYQEVSRQLDQELERLEEADFTEPGRIQDLPPDWKLWDVLASNTFQHYEDHLAQLKEWLRA